MSIKKLAGETVIYGLSSILPKALNFLVLTSYLTYKLEDTSDFAIFSEFYAYSTVILSFMIFRLDTAFFRFGSKAKDKTAVLSTTMIPLSILTLLVMGTLYFNAQWFADLLQYPDYPHYVKWFSFILGFDALTALIFANLRLSNRPLLFLFYKLVNILITVFALLFALEVMATYFPNVKAFLDTQMGIQKDLDYAFVANLVGSFSVCLLMLPEYLKLKITFDRALYWKMLKYSAPLVLVTIAGNINQAIAVPLQKNLLGGTLEENLTQAGIFSAAAKLAILLNLFTTAFNYAAEPFFFNNAAGKEDKSAYGKILYTFTLFCGAVVLGTYGLIDIFILIIGEQYRDAVFVVPILLIAYLLLGIYYNIAIWFKLSDQTYMGTIISSVGVIFTIAISVIALPSIGIIGSAWATLACYASMVILCFILGQRNYPIEYPVGKIVRIILITVMGTVGLYIIRNHTFLSEFKLILIGLSTLLGYLLINYLIDKTHIQRLIKS